MLFEEYQYFNYQFPEPQYLGAKHTLLPWLNQFIPKNIYTAVDAFAGSHSVGYLLKQQGCKVITNDFLNFNNQIGKDDDGNNKPRNYTSDEDGGRKRALIDALYGNKTQYASLIAQAILRKKDGHGKTIFPAKIDELFNKIAADLKIELP